MSVFRVVRYNVFSKLAHFRKWNLMLFMSRPQYRKERSQPPFSPMWSYFIFNFYYDFFLICYSHQLLFFLLQKFHWFVRRLFPVMSVFAIFTIFWIKDLNRQKKNDSQQCNIHKHVEMERKRASQCKCLNKNVRQYHPFRPRG